MKRFILGLLIVFTITCLIACDRGGTSTIEPAQIVDTNEDITTDAEPQREGLTSDEMYRGIIEDYKNALDEYDLEDVESEERILEKYKLLSPTLLMHITRYADNGTELTYAYYDIDKNGVEELLVKATDAIGAIYTYDKETNQVVKIFFQDTLERGNLTIYDNGVIFSEGSGGAALHYFEFGLIGTDGISYQKAESILEEYKEGSDMPEYRDADTDEVLEYRSLEEITNKYLSNAQPI